MQLIPIGTSFAGSTLTFANWKACSVTTISLYLWHLLMKPGFDVLRQLPNIRSFYPWDGALILNTHFPTPSKAGIYRFQSLYDGLWIEIDTQSVQDLVALLKPDILPYLMGDFSLQEMCALASDPHCVLESDRPAKDAMQGLLYTHQGIVEIQNPALRQDMNPLEVDCKCPTCSSKFTCAYLHHLFQHTPLLAQRFLVQHNIFYCQHYLVPL